uniref:Anthocyanidin 3-O-glucoside 6''-O-acyltransferase n=1 Tax=Zinnia elegans TaxID=34245 RepID=A0A8K1JX13_ZINEL|nr:anthocyanidin 3-O-glucoside 6''-O-acyltransferase [Zinnia elegans]
MGDTPNLTVLESCRVSPPPATIGHRSLPLTFFDVIWLTFAPVHFLFFYHFPHSKSHFMQTLVPKLKHSLSITLQHYFPFVGNLVVFPNNPHDSTRKPEIRHVEGDSVALTFAECSLDFNDLIGNHPRKCEYFHPLVPPLGSTVKGSDYIKLPVFAVQVTYFPNLGFSIGTTSHHSLADASTLFYFLKAWTSVCESGGDDAAFLTNGSQPIYDRLIDNPKVFEKRLKQIRLQGFYQPPSFVSPSDKVRATYVLTRTHVNGLKKQVQTQLPTLKYVSSFTVTCGYIWSCIVKSFVKMGEKTGEDELEQFVLSVDCRPRLDPPLPAYYLGNCSAPCVVTIRKHVLTGESGYVIAAKLIGEGISKLVNNKEGILKDAEKWHDDFKIPARKIGVAGTPKLNFYDIDFGWGKPVTYEVVSIDYMGSVSISASKESTQDLELGVCFSSAQMEAFAKIFNDGLESAIVS